MNIIPYNPEWSDKLPPDGVYSDVPNSVYHRGWDCAGRSGLKLMAIDELTPAHVRRAFLEPSEPSDAMLLGSAVDSLIFDKETLGVLPAPKVNKRTKDGRAEYAAFIAKNADKVILPHEDYEKAVKMVEALRAHPAASVLLEDPGFTQLSLVWTDPETKCRCKARPDKICPESGIAIDLKTAKSASKKSFAYSMHYYGYALQAWWYSWGLGSLGVMTVEHWINIVVENEPPHGVAVYRIGQASIGHTASQAMPHFRRLAECYKTGEWPAYPLDIKDIELPPWVFKQEFYQGE